MPFTKVDDVEVAKVDSISVDGTYDGRVQDDLEFLVGKTSESKLIKATLRSPDNSVNFDFEEDGGVTYLNATADLFGWVEETGSTRNLLNNEGVFGNSGSSQTFTLPSSSSVGDTFQIVQMGVGNVTVDYGTGQSIRVGNSVSTTTSGNLVTTDQGDWIEIVCNVTDTGFIANVKQGNITVN